MKLLKPIYFLLFFIIFSCDDEPLEGDFGTNNGNVVLSCQDATQNLATASDAFNNATPNSTGYNVLCHTYAASVQDVIDACGDETGAFQLILDSLDCPVVLDDCQIAQNETNSAELAYTANPSNETLCLAYSAAIQNEITICGDANGTLQALLDSINCSTNNASLIGTWRIISLTSNGVEELQDELSAAGICYWHEVYTASTLTDMEYSGTNCDTENIIETIDYSFANSIISFTNGDDPVEVTELTTTTLKYQDVYTESGVTYTDIYTYSRQ